MHAEDKEFLIKNQYNFQKMVLYWFKNYQKLGSALVIESKVIYLFSNPDMIAEEILHSQDHALNIRSNVPFYKIDGPNQYFGQDQYILLYIYKDVDFDNFYVRQIVYQNPILPIVNLVNDYNLTSTKFTTFLNDGSILG